MDGGGGGVKEPVLDLGRVLGVGEECWGEGRRKGDLDVRGGRVGGGGVLIGSLLSICLDPSSSILSYQIDFRSFCDCHGQCHCGHIDAYSIRSFHHQKHKS